MDVYLLTWTLILLAGTGVATVILGLPRGGFALALNLGVGSILGLLLGGIVVGLVAGTETASLTLRSLPVLAAVAVVCWTCAWRWRSAGVVDGPIRDQRRTVWILVAVFVLLVGPRLVPLATEVLLRPVFPWDAWAVWMVKPKVWFLSGQIEPFVDPVSWFAASDGVRTLAGANYPELSGRLQLLLAVAIDDWNEPLLLLPWLVLFVALLLAFVGMCRRLGCTPPVALTGCYVLASLPLVNAQVALAGYLDLWVGAALMLSVATWLLWRRERRPALLILALGFAGSMVLLKLEGVVWLALVLALIGFDAMSPRWQLRALWTAVIGVIALVIIAVGFGGWVDAQTKTWNVPGIRQLALGWRPGGLVIVTALFTHGNWHLLGLLLVGLPLLRWRQFRSDSEARLLGLFVLTAWIALLALFCLTPAAEWAVRQTATNRLVMQLAPVMVLWLTLLVRGWQPLARADVATA